jgi:hypothetical protein
MTARLPISIAIFEMLTADELHRFPTLDHWLTRPLSKPHAEGLSPEVKRHRRLAQVRMCRWRAKARDRYHPMRSTPKACVRGFVCERVPFNARCMACKRGDSPVQVRHHPPPR